MTLSKPLHPLPARSAVPDGSHQAPADRTAPPTAVDDPRAAAMLPPHLLHDGEIIILLLKPSPWFILLEALPALGWLFLLLVGGLLLVGEDWIYLGPTDLVLATLALAGLRLFWQFLEWLGRVYVLTDRRILRVRGVLRVQAFECALSRIMHTQTDFSLRERLLGLGTISFATAGTAGVEVSWCMLARPLEVHQIVLKTLDRYR